MIRTGTTSTDLDGATTLGELLHHRANRDPESIAYRFLEQVDAPPVPVSSAQLLHLARQVAADLQAHHDRGERILLLLPPGRPFVVGFFGAVLSGLVPVPAPAPSRVRFARSLPAIQRVAGDCSATALLTTAAIAQAMAASPAAAEGLSALRRHELERSLRSDAPSWVDPDLSPEDPAFLQYTSGSTSAPRGVVVTHGALLANLAAIHDAFQLTEDTRLVTWLPPHHDMGLVGGLLTPLRSMYDAVVLAPNDFVQAPARWLRAISEQRATLSGGPDFAYRLCVDRIRDEQLDGIDLSSWRTAFTGAEPISAETISAFTERFGPLGFRASAFYPCYGLAESTLMVTGGRAFAGPTVHEVSRSALHDDGAVRPPTSDADARSLVSCGHPVGAGTEVVIVGPDASERQRDQVGEIWVRGPSVTAGYVDRPDQTQATFAARTADGRGPFLRTGDLGVLTDDGLLVTGRLKDVIIVQGRTIDAHDVESAIRSAVPVHPQGMTAALSTVEDGRERFVIVHEIARREAEPARLVHAIQSAVAARFDIRADAVVLVRLGALPRTTSGKLRRSEATRLLAAGDLVPLSPDRQEDPVG